MHARKPIASVASFAERKRVPRKAPGDLERAAAPDTYHGDRQTVLRWLNNALATELVCVLRYRLHRSMARGLGADRIAEEFLLHADEELSQADMIAERIVQLGGEPDFAPDTLQARSHLQYVSVASISEMVRENLAAKRLAMESYVAFLQYLGEDDPTTRRMLESILSVEQAHADELTELLQDDG
jgi:bacterioferritin